MISIRTPPAVIDDNHGFNCNVAPSPPGSETISIRTPAVVINDGRFKYDYEVYDFSPNVAISSKKRYNTHQNNIEIRCSKRLRVACKFPSCSQIYLVAANS